MPFGKPAGVRCINLSDDNFCRIYNSASRPAVCKNLKPSLEMCGTENDYAINYLKRLEELTDPD
jgi:uncharacterized protein